MSEDVLKARIILGLPGSGKSTLSKAFEREGWEVVDPDLDFRGRGFSWDIEHEVLGSIIEYARSAAWDSYRNKNSYSIVFAESFTSFFPFACLLANLIELQFNVEVIILTTDEEKCRQRRISTGFPMDEWEFKRREWKANVPFFLKYMIEKEIFFYYQDDPHES